MNDGARMSNRMIRYAIGIIVLLVWGYIVVEITLLSRTASPNATYNLKLFWCLEEAWTMKNSDDWYFIVGNTLLFMPFGLIVPLCFEGMRRIIYTGAVGIVISSIIEVIQLIFHRGLFEFDDIYNNTIGVILGYGICILVVRITGHGKMGTGLERKAVGMIWLGTIAFYLFAVYMGQPVFDDLFLRAGVLLNELY